MGKSTPTETTLPRGEEAEGGRTVSTRSGHVTGERERPSQRGAEGTNPTLRAIWRPPPPHYRALSWRENRRTEEGGRSPLWGGGSTPPQVGRDEGSGTGALRSP